MPDEFESDIPYDLRAQAYRGMVEGTKSENPHLGDIPTDLMMRLMHRESTLRPEVVSPKGAVGLTQLLPDTAKWIRKKVGLQEEVELTNPEDNILTGMLYFKYLKDKFGSPEAALHAYNLGPTKYLQGKRNRPYVREVLGK